MRVLVFRRRNPIRLIRSWEPGVLQGDGTSAREGTGFLPGDHGSDQSPGPVCAADVALVVVVTLASLFGFVERARQVVLETDNGPLHYMGLDLAGRRPDPRRVRGPAVAALVPRVGARGRHALTAAWRNATGYPPAPLPYAVVVAAFTVAQRWPLPGSAVALVPVLLGMAASAFARFGTEVDDEVLTEVLGRPRRLGAGPGVPARSDPHPAARGPDPPARAAGPAPDPGAGDRRGAGRRPRTRQHRAGAARRGGQRRRHHRRAGRGRPTLRAARQQRLGEVLASIESLGREALTDMRRLVGVLRRSTTTWHGPPDPGWTSWRTSSPRWPGRAPTSGSW